MARSVLVVDLDRRRVPGPWDPEPVASAIGAGFRELADRGYDTEACLVGLDGEDVAATVTAALTSRAWDCVVVGGGLREPEELLEVFEDVVNLFHRHAPGAEMAFNARPGDTARAAVRRLGG